MEALHLDVDATVDLAMNPRRRVTDGSASESTLAPNCVTKTHLRWEVTLYGAPVFLEMIERNEEMLLIARVLRLCQVCGSAFLWSPLLSSKPLLREQNN